MTRGNQRDQDRLKAQKKAAQMTKPKTSGTSLTKKKEQDAEAMRQKQAKALAAKESLEADKSAGGKK